MRASVGGDDGGDAAREVVVRDGASIRADQEAQGFVRAAGIHGVRSVLQRDAPADFVLGAGSPAAQVAVRAGAGGGESPLSAGRAAGDSAVPEPNNGAEQRCRTTWRGKALTWLLRPRHRTLRVRFPSAASGARMPHV